MIKKAIGMIGLDVGEVYQAGNGMEALAQMADHQMGAVIADINMPVMNGLQLVHAMRRHDSLRDTPVIIVSTEGSSQRIQELEDKGIAGYIRKPFKPEQLREVLEPILGCTNEQDDFAHTAEDLF
ncbi:MAG: response regulator [Phycisphaerae bacterium]|nr:response regulator [Phycisphaerae bacterium]